MPPCLLGSCVQVSSDLLMVFLFAAEWKSPRTWPKIRTSDDLWPLSDPRCGYFHSGSFILSSNKCSARSHRSSRGCFLDVPLKSCETQCLGCAQDLLRRKRAPFSTLTFRNAILSSWEVVVVVSGGLPGPVCSPTTDGQLDSHDAAFWCHPHATYASPRGYDFLEIGGSCSPPQPSP